MRLSTSNRNYDFIFDMSKFVYAASLHFRSMERHDHLRELWRGACRREPVCDQQATVDISEAEKIGTMPRILRAVSFGLGGRFD
jgi:hypothetical protein